MKAFNVSLLVIAVCANAVPVREIANTADVSAGLTLDSTGATIPSEVAVPFVQTDDDVEPDPETAEKRAVDVIAQRAPKKSPTKPPKKDPKTKTTPTPTPTPTPKETSTTKPSPKSSTVSSAKPSASAETCLYKVKGKNIKAAKPMTLEEAKKNLRAVKKVLDDKKSTKSKGVEATPIAKPESPKARASKNHPSAKKPITLYHGTSEAAAKAILKDGVNSIKTNDKAGEFTAEGYSGFYMTDDKIAAAQYIKALKPELEPIAVLEFKWTPPDASKVKELNDETDEQLDLLTDFQTQNFNIMGDDLGIGFKSGDFDMISGPHIGRVRDDKIITQNMWQYAVTRKEGMKGLKVIGQHVYKRCDVPNGDLPYLKDFQDV